MNTSPAQVWCSSLMCFCSTRGRGGAVRAGGDREDGAALPPAESLRAAGGGRRPGGGRGVRGHRLQPGHAAPGQRPGQQTERVSTGSDEAALRSCLSRLLVVHCSSSSQLLLTLHFLESTMSSRPRLALLLLDSISAFYWPDRCEGGASMARREEKLAKCAELLGRMLRDYRFTIFATCHAIRRSSSAEPSSSSTDRPYLCRPWQRLVTHRLLCSRQEAGTGGERRQVFTAHCTSSRTRTSGTSSFWVTDGGVEFL
ncbi:DNA repair protein XRCC2 isoform X2 [Cololabis saira]|uniref:DNA repair protein XRCC2 isoform X2 n=1 Tax=Cololabis saira TaxID=129043 RepID=UPI002AD5210B|nr:DNA repair protein XRCC2 isoform X2 [Cololabis saira]